MGVKRVALGLAVSMAVIAVLLAVTDRKIQAQSDNGTTGELAQKIDQIAADQKAVIADLAEIKEQLRILTVRVTQDQ